LINNQQIKEAGHARRKARGRGQEARKRRPNYAEARQKALAGGLTPLEYLLSIVQNERAGKRERLDAAKAAAPYCHARLASTELSGPNGRPIETREIPDEKRARALAAFLARTMIEEKQRAEAEAESTVLGN
jgi:hypothetical protein